MINLYFLCLFQVYIVLLLFSNENSVYADQVRIYNLNDPVLSCSGWLSNIIFNICNNTYKIVKRDTSLMIEKMAPKALQKETARLQLVDEGQWRRVRRQVATQCCDRACTVADIITYCPNDAKLVQENPEIFE
uniref:SFRICE_002747 n=1 Tax=Spodoptera frugiperda TaxID=7108 RepID=A0A2H1V285_SPOFR